MKLLIRWGALAASFWIATALIPGIDVLGGFTTYLWVALLFGLINSILGGLITSFYTKEWGISHFNFWAISDCGQCFDAITYCAMER